MKPLEQPFATLPLFSDYTVDGETYRYHVCLDRYDHNACEQEGQGRCDTAAGVYYGCSDAMGGKVCPRHFYESHFGEKAICKLIDAPEGRG